MNLAPQQGRPIVWPRHQCLVIEQAVVAGRERVVHMHLDAPFGQSPELIEITKAIEKCRRPWIAPASCVGCFGEPERFTRFESIAEARIKCLDPVWPGKEIRGKSSRGGCLRCGSHGCAALRRRSVRVIGEAIEPGAGGLENVFSLDNAPREPNGKERNSFSRAAGAKDYHVWCSFLYEWKEDGKITPKRRRIVAFRGATPVRIGRFVHVFGGGDAAANGVGVGEELACLIRSPGASRISGSGACGKGCDEFRIHGVSKIDDSLRLPASQ